jgi:hypothetical protein
MNPEKVPHFCATEEDGEVVLLRVKVWLAKQGYGFLRVIYDCEINKILEAMQFYNPEIYYILGCASKLKKVDHAIVCCGDKIVCDPKTGKEADPSDFCKDSKDVFWIELLVPLSQTILGGN